MNLFLLCQFILGLALLQSGHVSQDVLDTRINASGYERDLAISPDGKEVFFTRQDSTGRKQQIMHLRKLADGSWSQPAPAWFSGTHRDLEPFFSPDGKKLFFASDRPKPGRSGTDVDIWVMEKTKKGWSEPMTDLSSGTDSGNPRKCWTPVLIPNFMSSMPMFRPMKQFLFSLLTEGPTIWAGGICT
jgi:hypothetical protein